MKRLLLLTYLISFLSFSQPNDLGYELNGIDDYITVPNTSYININGSVSVRTIETWFRVNNEVPRQVIFEEGAQVNAIMLYVENGALYSGAYKSNGNSARFFKSASNEILADTWYHVALVIDDSDGTTISWYLNGVLQDTQSGFAIPSHSGNISLGRNGGALRFPDCNFWSSSSTSDSASANCSNNTTDSSNVNYEFSGNVWGFRIWNSGRTSAEINTNMDLELTSGTDLVAYLDDDKINYIQSNGNWDTAHANGNTTTHTWSSNANSTNWFDSSNWVGNNVPSTTKLIKVVVPVSNNYPVVSSEVKLGRLELNSPDSEITIEDGGTLNVYYDVDNSGTITIENNGSFILQDDEAVSGAGNFVVKRDSPDYPQADFYSIWSTPIAELDSQINSAFPFSIIGYKYDASQNPSSYVQVGGSHNMEVGRGYFIRPDNVSGVQTVTFTGKVNNGTIEEPIYFNSDADSFNLIGNPYPSAISWEAFQKDNSDLLSGTMYYWSQSYMGLETLASDFISFNLTGSTVPETTGDIASGQGVFVKSLQAGTLKFKNSHRKIGNNNQFFRIADDVNNADAGKSWFRLTGPTGFSPMLIGFLPGATDDYENSYDAEFANEGTSVELYSFINSDKYDIQGLSELQQNQSKQVPLGFQVTQAGDYTISMVQEYIDPVFDILLEDTQLNTMTDLRTSDYTFNMTSPTEDNNRFILHYNYNQTLSNNDELLATNYVKTWFDGNKLLSEVSLNEKPTNVQLIDITGRMVFNVDYNDEIKTPFLSSGIYIIKYGFDDTRSMTKKVLKQ